MGSLHGFIDRLFWEPMWKTDAPKKINKATEVNALAKLLELAEIDYSQVDLVIGYGGSKRIRIKVFKGVENSIDLYDYLFYGPLVFANDKVYVRQNIQVSKEADDNSSSFKTTRSMLIEPEEVAKKIKADIARAAAGLGQTG